MLSKRSVAGLMAAALATAGLPACGEDETRATATGTTATTHAEPSEVPEGVAAQYAEFFHYAENFRIPDDGEYTLRATVEAPQFRRHGEESEGPALMGDAQVEFENVTIDVDA